MIMMHTYYENFNLNRNHILIECLEHLKIGGDYDTELFLVKILSMWKGDQSSKRRGSTFVEENRISGDQDKKDQSFMIVKQGGSIPKA